MVFEIRSTTMALLKIDVFYLMLNKPWDYLRFVRLADVHLLLTIYITYSGGLDGFNMYYAIKSSV